MGDFGQGVPEAHRRTLLDRWQGMEGGAATQVTGVNRDQLLDLPGLLARQHQPITAEETVIFIYIIELSEPLFIDFQGA